MQSSAGRNKEIKESKEMSVIMYQNCTMPNELPILSSEEISGRFFDS